MGTRGAGRNLTGRMSARGPLSLLGMPYRDERIHIRQAHMQRVRTPGLTAFIRVFLTETGMISGFNSMQGYDVARHTFNDWRELVAYGNISWPEKPPAALGEGVIWTEPHPYIHIHMALSGGPGKNEEVPVGHLSRGILKGGMTTQVYELVPVG